MTLFILLIFFNACNFITPKPVDNKSQLWTPPSISQDLEKAYFASGCFWCVEAVFDSLKGVSQVRVILVAKQRTPLITKSDTVKTGHAEAVEVIYDPKVVSFKILVDVFFGSHDPTTLNRQGPDSGTQYRSVAFYQNDIEKSAIDSHIVKLIEGEVYSNKIVTEVTPLVKFYYAEEYHQDYEKINPENSYIRNVSIPRLNRFRTKYPHLLKKIH